LLLRLAINRKPSEGSYSSRRQCDAIAREIAGFGADNVDGIEAVGIYNEWTRADGAPSQGNRDIHRPERSRFDPAFPAAKYNASHDEESETHARGRKDSHSYSDAKLAAMSPASANISKRSGKGGTNIERICCGLFFDLFDGIDFPPMTSDSRVISRNSVYGDRLSHLGCVAGNFWYALSHDATRSVHPFDSRGFADANRHVAVVALGNVRDKTAQSRVAGHFVRPAIRVFAYELANRQVCIETFGRFWRFDGMGDWGGTRIFLRLLRSGLRSRPQRRERHNEKKKQHQDFSHLDLTGAFSQG
jgi:hypothetical protein